MFQFSNIFQLCSKFPSFYSPSHSKFPFHCFSLVLVWISKFCFWPAATMTCFFGPLLDLESSISSLYLLSTLCQGLGFFSALDSSSLISWRDEKLGAFCMPPLPEVPLWLLMLQFSSFSCYLLQVLLVFNAAALSSCLSVFSEYLLMINQLNVFSPNCFCLSSSHMLLSAVTNAFQLFPFLYPPCLYAQWCSWLHSM